MTDILDQAGDVREGEELSGRTVTEYLKAFLPNLEGEPVIKQFAGGASNLTYELAYPSGSYILRRPPFGTKAKSAHDMGREFRIQSALKPVFPAVPNLIAYCDDDSVMGSEFYVMEKLVGIIPRADMPAGLDLPESDIKSLCSGFIDKLVDLHSVDTSVPALQEFGKGQGYVRRQIEGWSDRFRKAKTDNVPDFEKTIAWLKERICDDVKTCVIHNDYRMDNVVLNPESPTEIIGVLDWEMATLGDPLMDLGNSLAYWVQNDDPPYLQMVRRQPTHLAGMMRRDEVVEYYCDKMGFKNVEFDFYQVYGVFRLAVILQQIYYRYHHGQTKNPAFKSFHMMVTMLDNYCQEMIAKAAS